MQPDRRAFVAQTIALAAFPAAAIKPLPPPKTANIHWPGPSGELHGYMAIPASAHGAQPAVLVIHDVGGSDAFTQAFADRLASAGFVACAPNRIESLDEAAATIRWLAINAYATGKVGAIGLGWGSELVERIALSPKSFLTAGITFGGSPVRTAIPLLQLDAIGQMPVDAYDAAWSATIVFLKEHLA